MSVTITNTAPIFTTSLVDQYINQGSIYSYTLPVTYDAENMAVTIIPMYLGTTVLPGFVSFDPLTRLLTMQPSRGIDFGNYLITLDVSDGSLSTSYQLKINVNQPAKFSQDLADQTLYVGEFKTYQLPAYSDPESQPVTLTTMKYMSTGLPPFITYVA